MIAAVARVLHTDYSRIRIVHQPLRIARCAPDYNSDAKHKEPIVPHYRRVDNACIVDLKRYSKSNLTSSRRFPKYQVPHWIVQTSTTAMICAVSDTTEFRARVSRSVLCVQRVRFHFVNSKSGCHEL